MNGISTSQILWQINGTSVTASLEEIIMMKALSIVSLILSSVAAAVSLAAAVVSIVSIRNSRFQD